MIGVGKARSVGKKTQRERGKVFFLLVKKTIWFALQQAACYAMPLLFLSAKRDWLQKIAILIGKSFFEIRDPGGDWWIELIYA